MIRACWDFEYEPVRDGVYRDSIGTDFVVATRVAVNEPTLEQRLADYIDEATVAVMRPPIHWALVRTREPLSSEELERAAREAGLPVRYVASITHESLRLPERLDFENAARAAAGDWRARGSKAGPSRGGAGMWFLGSDGIAQDTSRFGVGEGTRLAVIDDDSAEIDKVDWDAQVLIDVESLPGSGRHAALMAAWAAGTRDGESGFAGVAPGASVRLYGIAKPGRGVLSLPLAILRAADDGADVIVTATYVEGTFSPMLDDALEFAVRLGRQGRGCAVVMPTGRQASSAGASLHASFSLGLGDPASDPRIFCVGPSGRGGNWFWWRDRKEKLRPFANRGPAVRFLAPGDDLADPFSAGERLCHAESSGAAAVAAGALLVLLEANPELTVGELSELVTRTARPILPEASPDASELADPSDALPEGRDPDGHDAKHGYGRIDLGRACLSAADPIASVLIMMGELDAARSYYDRRARNSPLTGGYSPVFGRWAARCLLAGSAAAEPLKAVMRHLRLLAARPERGSMHAPGAILRHFCVALNQQATYGVPEPPADIAVELDRLARRILEMSSSERERARIERSWVDLACDVVSESRRESGVREAAQRVELWAGGERSG